MILLNKFINYQRVTLDYGFYDYRLMINNKKVSLSNAEVVSIGPINSKKFIAHNRQYWRDTPYLYIKIHDFELEFYYDILSSISNINPGPSYKVLYLSFTNDKFDVSHIVQEYRRVVSLG